MFFQKLCFVKKKKNPKYSCQSVQTFWSWNALIYCLRMIFISRLPLVLFLKKTSYGQNVSHLEVILSRFLFYWKIMGKKLFWIKKIQNLKVAKQPNNLLFTKLWPTNQN